MTKEDICIRTGISMDELESGMSMVRLSGQMVDELPEGLGFHILELNDCPNLSRLPDNLTCTVLTVRDCVNFEKLPDNLQAEVLVIEHCPNLSSLPAIEGLTELEMKHCPNLVRLPEKLHLSVLYIEDSKIEVLPEDCLCLRDLSLRDCPYLTKLPDSCRAFSRDLILYHCPSISFLPDIRVVFGNLNIEGTSISALPENIKIGGCLTACGSRLKTLPEGIRVGEYIDLTNCKELESLPDGLIVNGTLGLAGTSIKQLPNRLIVGGNLNVLSTGIESFPPDLKVQGNISGSKRLLDVCEGCREVPGDLPYYIWKDSSYVYYDCKLYRVMSHDEFSWVVLDAEAAVCVMLDMDCSFYELDHGGLSYLVMDVNHNYGDGPTFEEAYKKMESRIRYKMGSNRNFVF